MGRLMVAWDGWLAARRKARALRALKVAVRSSPQVVAEIGLSAVVAAGFSLFKDGQEYGVFVGGRRVPPAENSVSERASSRAAPLPRMQSKPHGGQ
jgi:hypothetical protein